MKRYLLLLISLLILPLAGYSQNKTSSGIQGVVKDAQGNPLPGANVVAIFQPAGSRYGTSTRANGRYTIKNVRSGGPYRVQVSFVGYSSNKKEVTNIELGQTVNVNFMLQEGQLSLNEAVVSATINPVINKNRTGAKTNISRQEIDKTPQLSRSLQDFTRLTPQANGSGSFGGTNDRLNNLLVDGSTLNDIFGLGQGTPGSQAGVQSPISIDAIKEFNVDIAPFGVTNNNFNGAQINAITRSGTNTYTGSAYFQLRNQNLEGNFTKENGQTSQDASNFNQEFYGLRIGGPIIKNKLFFFVNGELRRQKAPLNAGIQGSGKGNIFPAPDSLFNTISNIFQNQYNYNPGSISPLGLRQDNNKLLAKLNWNINDENKFSLRYNHVDATDESGINRSSQSYDFSNRQYNFDSIQNSLVAELNSNFSKNISNTIRGVYTRIRDSRNVVDQPFPQTSISLRLDGDFRSINAGIGRFSQANSLGQDLFELTDNFTYIIGNNELTFGTSNQFFHFNNRFVQDAFGTYQFRSIDGLKNGNPFSYNYSYLLPGGKPRAKFNAIQAGFYAQDRWSATERFTLTAGLRIDIPFLPQKPTANPDVIGAFPQLPNARTDRVASGNILWSPRLGFNWDVSRGNLTTQVRGGAGIFSGPPPFVLVSNQFSNTGADFGRVDTDDNRTDALGDDFFSPDPNNQPSPLDPNSSLSGVKTTEVDLITKDFKYPQSAKFDLAVDQELPFGITATLEGIYSKGINNLLFKNVNLQQVGTSAFGRPLYGDIFYNSRFNNADGRASRVDPNFTNAILLTNTNKGYRYNLTAELQKQFPSGLAFHLSYNYNRARNINNATSSRAISNFQFNEAKDVNNPRLGTADFERRNRVLARASYRFDYGKGFATTVSVIYDGISGTPYSWIYNGNANGDIQRTNDLIFVPSSPDDIVLTSNNYNQLNQFISNTPSLNKYRGEVVPRNSAREPFNNFLDIRINQRIGTVHGQNIEFTASMFNFLNFLNQDWGARRSAAGFNNVQLLNFQGYVDKSFIASNPQYNLDSGDLNKPIVAFDPRDATRNDIYQINNISSRWRLQVGVRYNF